MTFSVNQFSDWSWHFENNLILTYQEKYNECQNVSILENHKCHNSKNSNPLFIPLIIKFGINIWGTWMMEYLFNRLRVLQ